MELALAITSYQRLSPTVSSSQTFASTGTYVLGREAGCDWHLPDPDRVVSSRHAEIGFRDGRFWIRDISTNGVFLNGGSEPLGNGATRSLADGDSVRLGDYEIGVSLAESGQLDARGGPEQTCEPQPPVVAAAASEAVSPGGESSVGEPDAIPGMAGPGDLPMPEAQGGNPTLASGLSEHRIGDSHVDIPDLAIPPVWEWDKGGSDAKQPDQSLASTNDQLEALFAGLGMPHLAEQGVSSELLHNLGDLTRILLERLLDLLHARAVQKQKLRTRQTLFNRSENNPLKFSATAQDAFDALLLRRSSSFMAPRDAVEEAFADILRHDRALMAGVESVVAELLQDKDAHSDAAFGHRLRVLRKARAHDELISKHARHKEEFGDIDRMLRSDTFVEAYESSEGQS